MTDLTDFKRLIYEPEVAALKARITELEQQVNFRHGDYEFAARRARDAEARVAELTKALEKVRAKIRVTPHTSEGLQELAALAAPEDTSEKPEGWPDKCANCGASWEHIGYDHADGFNCRSCGACDSDE